VAQPPASFVGRLEECGFSIFSSMSTKNTWVVVANIFFQSLAGEMVQFDLRIFFKRVETAS